ncbi:MAG: response regulator transcription factor, partial [Ruminococcaceae bacterium]|nr:response regulator transcription factor [Oscillospiraceae bacterium]
LLYNKGWQKKEIANHLSVSLAYVKKQIQIIYEKLNIQSKFELSKYLSE